MKAPSKPQRGVPTRVERTGIALVHEGELILPALGSEADVARVEEGRVEFCFPVEIEIRESAAASEALIAEVLRRLGRALG